MDADAALRAFRVINHSQIIDYGNRRRRAILFADSAGNAGDGADFFGLSPLIEIFARD